MFAIRDERTTVRPGDFHDAYEKVEEEDDAAGTPIAFA
jgi:ATP-dependent 26S proteasome regulatory subunit